MPKIPAEGKYYRSSQLRLKYMDSDDLSFLIEYLIVGNSPEDLAIQALEGMSDGDIQAIFNARDDMNNEE